MKQLVFATANPHKIEEVQALLPANWNLLGLLDIGCHEDIPETQDTIIGNAIQKAQYVVDHYQHDCFAEDTGLEIEALHGAPGVYSARYAGPQRDSQANMSLVLQQLQGQQNRKARFKTVIALIVDKQVHTFEGIVNGTIREEAVGEGGFGYDPIFQPDGYELTFAQMPAEEKNRISHRGHAVQKLLKFLGA